jgi:hypothetical protein
MEDVIKRDVDGKRGRGGLSWRPVPPSQCTGPGGVLFASCRWGSERKGPFAQSGPPIGVWKKTDLLVKSFPNRSRESASQ